MSGFGFLIILGETPVWPQAGAKRGGLWVTLGHFLHLYPCGILNRGLPCGMSGDPTSKSTCLATRCCPLRAPGLVPPCVPGAQPSQAGGACDAVRAH